MNLHRTYLDHAATSPLRPEAMDAWRACIGEADCNPASAHAFGRRAQDTLEQAREEIASLVETEATSVVFTAGGTVSDNLAVLGFARAHMEREPLIVISAVEHRAVLAAAERAGQEGAEVAVLNVNADGVVDPADLEVTLARKHGRAALVSVMWANNEVGAVQPVAELCEIAHDSGAVFHTDAVQAFGKLSVSLSDLPADLLTITAHKIGGPVGIGALLIRGGIELEPLVYGGSQERAIWPGTQNPCGAAAFAAAARSTVIEIDRATARWTAMREALASDLRTGIEGLIVHAESAPVRLPQLLSVGVPGADPATLLMSMDLAGIAVSSGSACSSGVQTGSHVLAAMGINPGAEYAVIRFSFGPFTTEHEVREAGRVTVEAAARARSVVAG
ncbi:MAG: cysteine desulfurase [marine benthic group bacterium]|nr:cysteine desulfurase [Gemmatimonadota bacterium]MCL7974099.1 cysteine desulfurase [Gemmatimonadota bacterium]